MTPELHRQLRALLADLYPTRADLTRVAYRCKHSVHPVVQTVARA